MIFTDAPELLAGYRRGDPAALAEVYRHYVQEISLLVRRGFLTGSTWVPGIRDPGAECDLIQETFTRAFSETARGNYDATAPFRPYLFRILKNLMIDQLRRRRDMVSTDELHPFRAIQLEAVIAAGTPLPDEPDPEQAGLLAAAAEYAGSLAGELASYYRLRYREELSQLAVAEKLGITRRRARTLEERLRAGLRMHLKQVGLLDRLGR